MLAEKGFLMFSESSKRSIERNGLIKSLEEKYLAKYLAA